MRRLLLAFALLLGFAAPAATEEAIRNFVSDVTVNRDASLTVRETIAVNAEGLEIRRGILRDFPTVYTDRHGRRAQVGFDVLGVKRDGRPEPYAVETLGNGVRIRIGDADVFLDRRVHTYEISYRTTRQIGFFDDFDELYWNVTGNGWTFPIDVATAILRLPPGARIGAHAAYTGPQGSTANDAHVFSASGSEYRASTTRRQAPGEGFTVAVAWQKGLVTPPTETQEWGWWLRDNGGLIALIGSLLATGGFYLFAWNRVGRDPPKGTIIPLFQPPRGLGPAASRFVWRQGYDDRGFAAALVGLAVKGRLKIIESGSGFAIEKLGGGPAPLTPAEQALSQQIPAGRTELKSANHARVGGLRKTLEQSLVAEYEGSAFIRNLGWFWQGAAISAAGLVLGALLLPAGDGLLGLFTVGWSSIWWGVVLAVAWGAIKGVFSQRHLGGKIMSLMTLLFLIPFFGGGLMAPAAVLFGNGSPALYMLIGTAVLLGIVNMAFFHLLRAPTLEGRKLMDQIEGFRLYMTTAEEDRLQVLHPPEKTPELFERYLPFALALDCENEWNAKFAAVLAAAAAAGATAPAWYSGSHWDAGRTGGFTDSLGSSLSSTVSSAATAPGSRSGSGGGGSSGGGGGGGGGSGW